MDLQKLIRPELLFLVPALNLIGAGLKRADNISDKYIPLLLGAGGMIIATLYLLATEGLGNPLEVLLNGILQGLLCAAASVYAHQIYRQAGKD